MRSYTNTMEIQKILRKLEPLMPRRVEKWARILDTSQPEVKELIENPVQLLFKGLDPEKILLEI